MVCIEQQAPGGHWLALRMLRDERDLQSAQRLRYRVFVEELGGTGPMVDHAARLECDAFDPFFDHLGLVDTRRDPETLDHVVGVYRLLRCARAAQAGGFYCDTEFDLSPLKSSGRRLLELGRSCVDPDHRGGVAMLMLWQGLAEYVAANGIEILFGAASFRGTDLQALAEPLSWLHHHHLAPSDLRVGTCPEFYHSMNMLPLDALDSRTAMAQIPSLIKGYLRMGGCVGDGAFVDHAFNTTDVCLIMDTTTMSGRQRDFYTRKPRLMPA